MWCVYIRMVAGTIVLAKPVVNVRVALGSGGLKGIYQYGFFKALERLDRERQMLRYDRVYGSSIGSINAPFVAAKQVHTLEGLWEVEDPLKGVMQGDWWRWLVGWMGKSKQCMLGVVLRGSWFKGYEEQVFRKAWEMAGMTDKIAGDCGEVGYVCCDVQEARETWGRMRTFDEYFEGVRRSAALPLLVPYYKSAEGVWYMDGGLTEDVPLGRLWSKDFDGEYLVMDNGLAFDSNPSDDVPVIGQFEQMISVCRRLIRREDFERVMLPKGQTSVYTPINLFPGAAMFATRKDLKKWIEQGERDAEGWYEGIVKKYAPPQGTTEAGGGSDGEALHD
jgi:predicted acylesterase/phospholipase RssA